MATYFDISPTLVLQQTDSRARVLDLSDFFLCEAGGAANSITTENPDIDIVIVEEGDTILLDADQIGNVTPKENGAAVGSDCEFPEDEPVTGAKTLKILPSTGNDGDICVDYGDFDNDFLLEDDVTGDTSISFAKACGEIVEFDIQDFNTRGCYGKITINPIKLEGSVELTGQRTEIEEVNGVVRRRKLYNQYRLRLKPISEKIATLLINHLSTNRVLINGISYDNIDAPTKNNGLNEFWVIDIRLERFLCDENIC